MKLNIYKSEGIHQMGRNHKLSPGNLFLIGSESVSNSLYFRRSEDIKYAHKVINQKLSGILNVNDYLFAPKGWLLLVKFKSRKDIIGYYQRLKSKTKGNIKNLEAEEIISEVIRLAISSIAAFVNRRSKRKGALVYRAFMRFKISSINAVKKLIGKMKKREIILSNQRRQFQPSLKHWNTKVLSNIGMCFLSCDQREVDLIIQDRLISLKQINNSEIAASLVYKDDVKFRCKVLNVRNDFDW